MTVDGSTIEFNDVKDLRNYITDYIVKFFKFKYPETYLIKNYNFLTDSDKKKILNLTPRCLELQVIIEEINLITNLNCSFDIKGILNFRLKDSKKYVNMLIDILVEENIVYNEYLSLISLIQHIISTAYDNKYINIIFLTNGNIYWNIENKKGSVGANRNFYSKETLIEEILIETILREKPEKVIIHNINFAKSRDFIKTLINIYDSKFYICNGCNICSNINY